MTNPIPLERQCHICGHSTAALLYVRESRTEGFLCWKRHLPWKFVYRCRTYGSTVGATHEVLDREARSKERS